MHPTMVELVVTFFGGTTGMDPRQKGGGVGLWNYRRTSIILCLEVLTNAPLGLRVGSAQHVGFASLEGENAWPTRDGMMKVGTQEQSRGGA